MEILRLGLYQFAPRLCDIEANLRRISQCAADCEADLILTPELSATGYDLGDDASHLATRIALGEPLSGTQLADVSSHVLLGLPERGEGAVTYNTIAVVTGGIVQFRHRKVYLPTYGMFDEGRYFGRGREVVPWQFGPWRIGLLICEDFWHPGLAYVLACAGIHLLLVAAAAPGRGVWQEPPHYNAEATGRFASAVVWERIARCYAQLYGIFVALANRTGVEGNTTFAGGSVIVGPDGQVLARADEEEETVLRADLCMSELERARRPFAHARDEDRSLVISALQRQGGD
jgi:predicted amidohydrolase